MIIFLSSDKVLFTENAWRNLKLAFFFKMISKLALLNFSNAVWVIAAFNLVLGAFKINMSKHEFS